MTTNNFHNRKDLRQMLKNPNYKLSKPEILLVNGTHKTFKQARELFKQSLPGVTFSYKGFWIEVEPFDQTENDHPEDSFTYTNYIKDDTLIDPTKFFDVAIDHPRTFGNFSRNAQQHIYEKIYTEQGFANNPDYNLKRAIPVTYKKDGSPKDVFEIRYYRLNSNLTFDFSTTYKGWQNQEDMPHDHACYLFWKKWNIFHLTTLTIDEWQEMHEDLQTIEKEVAKKAIHR